MAAGLRATSSSTVAVCGTTSEYSWASRTRRAISWAYCAPKSTTSTGRLTISGPPGRGIFTIFPVRRLASVHRVELRGGLNTVWLIDGRVHRPAGPWSSRVHALLRHVSDAGFDAAPVPFGFDLEGREVLSYVPGEVGHHFPVSDEAVISAARLLRRYHD